MNFSTLKYHWHTLRINVGRLMMALGLKSWGREVFARALYSRGTITRKMNGASASFRVTDLGDYAVLVGRQYEEDVLKTFLSKLRATDVVYEVGAHIGSWTVFIAKRVAQGSVLAFEPEPRNGARLQEHVTRNGLSNVCVEKKAVSDAPGKATFGISNTTGDGRHSLILHEHHSRTVEVDLIRLDDVPAALATKAPDVVKIDVEGAETRVIRGMAQMLSARQPRLILLELHPRAIEHDGEDPQFPVRAIQEAGYQIMESWPRDHETIYLFVRKGEPTASHT